MVNQLTNELRESLKEIIEEVKLSKDYQDYLKIEDKLMGNKEITDLISDIKRLQKELVKKEYYQKDLTSVKEEHESKLQKLNSYPLYVGYLESQRKINEKLQYVRGEIQSFFDEITLSWLVFTA